MLAEFNKDAAILFQHNESPFGASFVTCLEHALLCIMVRCRFSGVQCCPVTTRYISSVPPTPNDK